jgi:hypothetical protein
MPEMLVAVAARFESAITRKTKMSGKVYDNTELRGTAQEECRGPSGVSLAKALRVPHMQSNVGALPAAANQTPQKRTRSMTQHNRCWCGAGGW